MRISFIISLLTLFSISGNILSQDKKAFKNDFLEAEYFFLNEHYDESAFLFQQLIKGDPENYNLHFLLGASYLSTQSEKLLAIPHLELAAEHISPSYREGSWKERNAPREALFALAKAYHVANRFEESIELYKKYLNIMGVYDEAEADYVQKHIASAKMAKAIVNDTTSLSFNDIGKLFDYQGYRAVIAEKDSTLVFMTEKPFYTAIMMSKWVNGSWTEPEVINDELKIDGKYNVCSISYDGKELYVSLEKDFNYDIFVSYFEDGKWKPVQRLNEGINSKYNETHASISKDKRTLYFTSDRPGGIGATDIYYSERNEDATWSEPVNLGETINSIFSEETPFLSADGKTLYFSSKGHETMGGFDVFFSMLQPDNQWSTPVNYGYPLNTSDDDLFLVPLEAERQALFTSSGGLLPQNTILALTIVPKDIPEPDNTTVDDYIISELKKIESGLNVPQEQTVSEQELLAENNQQPLRIDNQAIMTENYNKPSDQDQQEPFTDIAQEEDGESIEIESNISTEASARVDNEHSSDEHKEMPQNIDISKPFTDIAQEEHDESIEIESNISTDASVWIDNDNSSNDSGEMPQDIGISQSSTDESFQLIIAEESVQPTHEVVPPDNYFSSTGTSPELKATDEAEAKEIFILNGTILFSFDSYRLNEAAMNTLDRLHAILKLKPELNVEIAGYTDSKGKAQYNLYLAKKRADEVINYLVKKGVPRSSLISTGAGASNFIAINTNPDGSDNPEGRKYNRRAEISLLNNIDESVIVEALKIPDHLKHEISSTLNPYLAKTTEESSKEVSSRSAKSTKGYTIQLLAMRNPVRENFFNSSEKVIRVQGEDGLYRYISGSYESINAAKADIGYFREQGFEDAFIRVVPLEI